MHVDPFLLTSTTLNLLPQSLIDYNNVEYGISRFSNELRLVVLGQAGSTAAIIFNGENSLHAGRPLIIAPMSPQNAAALRNQLPWLQPKLLGVQTSAGMGDRLGLATPGHIRAIRKTGGSIAPIFAQQSIREMTRTGRTPQQVMDDATWGMFQENWQGGFGADADHLKTSQDIDACLAAGYTFFTIDPGAYVDNRAESMTVSDLQAMAEKLPQKLQSNASDLINQKVHIEHVKSTFDESTLLRAMVKYGHAIWHVTKMYRRLEEVAGEGTFEMEVSVDETEQPTSHAEHVYIASQLKDLGVKWVSLAPRYVGDFEKGVDYIGDVAAFEADVAGHAAIARHFGPYKLSLHSGSDKFSIYPAAVRQTQGLIHLKTAGTSYLEALRTIAALDVDLFRKIYVFAREHYEADKATYHVSAQLARAPEPENVTDWPGLLEQFDARMILHHTYGSVLSQQTAEGKKQFYDQLMSLLRAHPDAYAKNLEKHFMRHLRPFLPTVEGGASTLKT